MRLLELLSISAGNSNARLYTLRKFHPEINMKKEYFTITLDHAIKFIVSTMQVAYGELRCSVEKRHQVLR